VADCHTPTNGGNQKLIFINESNLYRVFSDRTNPKPSISKTGYLQKFCQHRKTGEYSSPHARQTAFDELNRLCMQEKVSKEKGTFHSHGMHRRKHEKHLNALRIKTCKPIYKLLFEGLVYEK
jgi:prophage antirepressor-like protein